MHLPEDGNMSDLNTLKVCGVYNTPSSIYVHLLFVIYYIDLLVQILRQSV